MLENRGAMRQQWSLIELLTALLGKHVNGKIVTMSQHECQGRVNELCTGNFENVSLMGRS